MTTGQVIALALASPFILFIAARLVTAAYFISKREAQKEIQHG